MPLVIVLTYVPLALGAVEQREMVFLYLLGPLGGSSDSGVSACLIIFASVTALALAGAIAHVMGRRGSASADSAAVHLDKPCKAGRE